MKMKHSVFVVVKIAGLVVVANVVKVERLIVKVTMSMRQKWRIL